MKKQNNYEQRIEKIKNGCCKYRLETSFFDKEVLILCPTCQAKLEALQEGYKLGLEETEERIKLATQKKAEITGGENGK